MRSWEKFLGHSKPVSIIISKPKTELEQKLEWFTYKGSGAILKAYKFLYDNNLLHEYEKSNYLALNNMEYPPDLASGLIEGQFSLKRRFNPYNQRKYQKEKLTMAKMLSQNDWNFNNIGTKFELDEVIPKFETEVRADANGEIIKNRDGSERRFNTDKIIGWKYNVTIKDGQFKKEINPSLSRQSRCLS